MTVKLPAIPAISPVKDQTVATILRPMKESIELLGAAVTGDSLANPNASVPSTWGSGSGANINPDTVFFYDFTPPPTPQDLSISGAFQNIILSWTSPTYSNHAYTEVWRATTNSIGAASLLGFAPGSVYVDAVGVGKTYYYWIRFRSTSDVTGPYNGVSGTTGSTSLVGTSDLSDAIITAGKIASGAIDLGGTKITGLLQNTNLAQITDATKIADSLIGNTKLANLAVDAAKLADSAVTSTKIANAAVGTAAIQNAAITNALIANAAIGSAQIQDAAIIAAKIGTAAVGSAAIQDAAITNAKIANLAVDSAKIADLAVGTAKINDAAITTAKIADASITNAKIGLATITTANIQDAAITTAKIADANITSAKIADANITSAKIADANITTAKIADANITSAKIADANITTAKIADAAITNAKIGTAAIAAANIQDAAITSAKIGDAQIVTAKIGTAQVDALQIAGFAATIPGAVTGNQFSTSQNAFTGDIVSIVHNSRGADIVVWLLCPNPSGATGFSGTYQIYRDGVLIAERSFVDSGMVLLSAPSGDVTYTVRIRRSYNTSVHPGCVLVIVGYRR